LGCAKLVNMVQEGKCGENVQRKDEISRENWTWERSGQSDSAKNTAFWAAMTCIFL